MIRLVRDDRGRSERRRIVGVGRIGGMWLGRE